MGQEVGTQQRWALDVRAPLPKDLGAEPCFRRMVSEKSWLDEIEWKHLE